MADGVDITAGTGTKILTDDTGAGGHAQVIKLAESKDGSGTLIPGDISGLRVNLPPGTLDSFGSVKTGGVNNAVDIQFYRGDGSVGDLVTETNANGGTASATGGMATFATTTSANSQAKGVTTQSVVYTAGAEVYCLFTAAFTGTGSGTSYHRIGLYDTNNGFFIGYEGGTFGATVRKGGSDVQTAKASFNLDTLTGAATSRFTRAGSPEAINLANLNVWRIRFGWVGSAPVVYEVLSPDGLWVPFHVIRQPNLAALPSINTADLPVTCDVNSGNSSTALSILTNCWCAGTTTALGKLSATLSADNYAQLTRSVITGYSTSGGGAFVNVKVNPSGAMSVSGPTSEDAASADGDPGFPMLAVRKATPANTSNADGDYEFLQMSGGRLWVDASGQTLTVGSHAVTNAGTFATQTTTATSSGNTTLQNAVSATGNGSSLTVTGYGTALLSITGSFVATVTFEGSTDAGTNWAAVSATQIGTSVVSTTATAVGQYRINVAGLDLIRARVTWTSGTSITVIGRATNAVNSNKVVTVSTNSIAKAEDAASADADIGVPAMAVRKATPANTSGTDGDYEMLQMSNGRLWVDASGQTLTVGSHAVTNAGTFAVQVDGSALTSLQLIDDPVIADDAAFTIGTSKVMMSGGAIVAHGSAPDAADAGDGAAPIMNRHRIPFVLGGHPNIVTLRATYAASAQTDTALVTVSAGTKIVVTQAQVTVSNATTATPSVVIGFGTANTPTTTGVVLAHPGIPGGGGVSRGDGSGILGIGADNEDLRITAAAATGGTLDVVISYFTIES